MQSKFKKIAFILIILVPCHAFSFALHQLSVERVLKENREFIEFLNIGVSNFAPEKEEELKKIYQKHFNAEIAFLQSEYRRSFDNIYSSQKDMVGLSQYLLTRHYLEDAKKVLDDMSPMIIRSGSQSAKKYLTLGYRDITVARTYLKIGEASFPKLYSYKIFKFIEAIKMCRRAKRYGFLALYAGQKIAVKKKIINEVIKKENKEGGLFFQRYLDKSDDEYIREMKVDFDSFEKKFLKEQEEGLKQKKDSNFKFHSEKRVARRVRFRKENQFALYLLNGELEKGEPLVRYYIKKYPYKLIRATLSVLSLDGGHVGEERGSYQKYIPHHRDNYGYLVGGSFIKKHEKEVRVIDNINKDSQEEQRDSQVGDKSKQNTQNEKVKLQTKDKPE